MRELPRRFCIFCGKPPQNKNLEHPLPRWILEMTGDPNRVVKHGTRWSSGAPIEFSWDSLVFPACLDCNETYSSLEQQVKAVVEAICKRAPIEAESYVLLLDWLDKVRIGLWLGYRYLQQNPLGIPPKFTIDSRIGSKDRMVAVYPIGDHQVGLNTWGTETLLFQIKPSVFALRVNDTLFLNASWDFMCSERCGYPFPVRCEVVLDQAGAIRVGDFRRRRAPSSRVMKGLPKAAVTLYQPVLQCDLEGGPMPMGRHDIEYCRSNAWPGRATLGPLLRQLSSHTVRVGQGDICIEFDSISMREANRAVDIATQAYYLQVESVRNERRVASNQALLDSHSALVREAIKLNRKTAGILRSLSPDDYARFSTASRPV